jgi:23S rRNA (cytidine2498-2'-O)-methyltransferase
LNFEDSFKNIKGSIEHISDNGLTFEPIRTVDWLVCDMVMPSKDTLRVLTKWQQKALMRHFVVNIKLSKSNIWPQTKQVLDVLKGFEWAQTRARQLIHDRNEITLFGSKHL